MKWRHKHVSAEPRQHVGMCSIKLAYQSCRRAFIVSEPKKTFFIQTSGLNRSLHFTLFRVFEFSFLQFSLLHFFPVFRFFSFSISWIPFFPVGDPWSHARLFQWSWYFFKTEKLKTRNEKPKNCPWSLYLRWWRNFAYRNQQHRIFWSFVSLLLCSWQAIMA